MYDFSSISNRLMQVDFDDYNSVLSKFLDFISNTPIILDYIKDCGDCSWNLGKEINEVQNSYGNSFFDLGESDEEEVRNIYALLIYIKEHNINICSGIAMGYSHTFKYQDMVKGFNERVVYVLIRYIDRYLTKIGIEMGMDERNTYNITVKNGQVNIANNNSNIQAYNKFSSSQKDISELIENIKALSKQQNFDDNEIENLNCSLDVISEEIKEEKPRINYLKTALNGIKIVKGTTEFAAAVAQLVQFLQPFLIR